MRSPLDNGQWIELDEVDSTQAAVATLLLSADTRPGVVFAHHQTRGRGRFSRDWTSNRDSSLTMSLVFSDQEKPWLLGMAVAIACARVLGGGVQWPNDIVIGGKKVGGILTELLSDSSGHNVPVVGVGINLGEGSYPDELKNRATSLFNETGRTLAALEAARLIIEELSRLPEPSDWPSIAAQWAQLDKTPGKQYVLHIGETARAIRVTNDGALLCETNGNQVTVLAADALFGPQP